MDISDINLDMITDDIVVAIADMLKSDPQLSGQISTEQLQLIYDRAALQSDDKNSMTVKIRNLNDVSGDPSKAAVLKVRDLTYPLDEIASKARTATHEFYKQELSELPRNIKRIEARGITSVVAKVTKRLNARGLEDIERLLIALPALYEFLLIKALDDQNIKADDDQGLLDAVLRALVMKPRRRFLNEITGRVLDAENIQLKDAQLSALSDLMFKESISLRPGDVHNAVLKLVDDGQQVGALREYVDRYAGNGKIDEGLFTSSIRAEMARFLYARGLKVKDRLAFDSGKYDELFALAYNHAARVAEGDDDPVDVARNRGAVSDWNFTIRRISEVARPIIRQQAILAAGALYTTFVEGEQMHVFDIADALLLDWHRGDLDIPDGETAALLNRYEHQMRERPDEEARQMVFKKVFNIGDAEMLSGTVVNEAFPNLWDNLMYEVTRYIDKTERYYTEEKFISRTAIYQAIQELQYNLSEYMTGSAPKKTAEMYSNLKEALDILGSEDVLNHIGGRRKTVLAVIERMGKKALGIAIPATSLVTVAERGNDIFRFIAGFVAENVEDDEFQNFLDACKACIVSQAALEPHDDETDANRTSNSDPVNGNGRRQNGYRSQNESSNGNAARRLETVSSRNGNGGGNFDDWDS